MNTQPSLAPESPKIAAQPDVLVGMSNDAWTLRTPIPRWRSTALGSIARLLDIPVLAATNR